LSNWTKNDMTRLLKVNGFKVKHIYGTTINIPLINVSILVGPFYMLGWVLIYEAIKISNPINKIITKDENSNIVLCKK